EELQTAPMRFGDRPAERETESGAAAVARPRVVHAREAFEECRAGGRRDPWALISHLDVPSSCGWRTGEPHRAPGRAVPGGVVDQVVHHTTEQVRVGRDDPGV